MKLSHPARQPLSVPRRLSLAVHSACLALAMTTATTLAVIPVQSVLAADIAATTATVRSYGIPAGPLGGVLSVFATEAGISVSYPPALVEGLRSDGLRGQYGAHEGLMRILSGTGLEAVPKGQGLFVLRRLPTGSVILPEVQVSASAERDGTTEGTGSYTTRVMSTATKMNLSPRETPQSVSVLTRQQMDDQGMVTLDDAIINITGLVMQKGYHAGDSGNFSARGFPVSTLMYDGLPTMTGANGTFNADNGSLDIYDRVEVVRGATGLITGAGTPSAAINLVRKRPTAEAQSSITVSAGSWNNFRTVLDSSGALNEAATLRGRAVVSLQDSKQFYDDAHIRNQQFYGVLEADLTPATVATLGFHYRNVDNTGGYQGLPTNPDGTFLKGLKRSTNLSNDFDFWKQTDTTVFADIAHKFDGGWQVKAAAMWMRPEQDMLFSGLSNIGGVFYQDSQHYRLDNKQNSYDISASGPFSLLGRTHELMVGASYRTRENKNWGGWAAYSWSAAGPVVDPYHWDSSSVAKPDIDMSLWNHVTTVRQKAVYGATRLSLADPLKLILGARATWYEHDQVSASTITDFKVSHEITPYAGLIYDINRNHSVYASWTEIFEPQTSFDSSGSMLKPITGTNKEMGIKGEYFGGRLNANLATFIVTQQNRAVSDLSGPFPCPSTGWGYCSRAAGEIESKGIEFEVSGALTPNWQLMAGYSYVSAKYSKDSDASRVGELYDGDMPRHQLKLTTNYKLQGEYSRWRIGGSIYAQNSIYASDSPSIEQSGYAIVGLNAGYAWSRNMDIRLNINNLFDKNYYQNIGWTTGGNVFGAPRNFMLTGKYTF